MNKRRKTIGLLTMATIVPMALPVSQIANNKILLSSNKNNESKSTAQINKLYNEEIHVSNVWNYSVFNIGFNSNNTFNISGGNCYLNPYYNGNNSMTFILSNSDGKILYKQNFGGGAHPYEDLSNALKDKKFNYGDMISIISRSGAHFNVNGIKSTKEINYMITSNGLKKLSNTSISDLEAYYNGNNTVVSGITKANTLVNLWIGKDSYKTISSSNGTFKYTLPKTVTPGTKVFVYPHEEAGESTVVISNPSIYKIEKGNIELYGNWGGIYKFANIGFNAYTMKFNVTIPQNNPAMCGATSETVYTIGLYNKDAKLIVSKSFLGETNAATFKKWMDNISFKYGEYLSVKSQSLNMSINGGPKSEANVLGRITTNGLENVKQPIIKIATNYMEINSYDDAKVFINIKGKEYNCDTNCIGQANFKIPNNLNLNTPMQVIVEKNGIRTMPITVYSSYENTSKEFSYNMFRYASLSPSNKVDLKGDDMTLTSDEPIPLEFSEQAKVVLDVKGDVTGNAVVYMNNGYGREYLKTIKVNTPTVINISQNGALIIDTSNVDYKGNQDSKFNFKINVNVKEGYYRPIPVFDNRGFVKIDSQATNNEELFNKEIFSPSNINHGAIMIGDHVRMYIPNVGKSLPTTFNAENTVNWYNEAFVSDNKLSGLSQNATNQLNKFHTNFFYVTTYTTDNSDGWWTGGGGTSAIPSMFKIGLTTPGWVMFHEVGHIFDPGWADSFGGSEIYSNMYTAETQLKIEHMASWGQGQPGYNKKNTLPIFENYAKGIPPQKYMNMNTGLEYFKLLYSYFPTMMEKTDDLYRTQWYNNDLPYNGVDFLAYAMADIYHTNIIPSLNMWGCNITNQNLIKYVIVHSNDTTNLVPKESYFDKYRNMSVPVTMLTPQLINNNYVIEGMANPNSKVTVEYGGKNYIATCNSTGKFTITFLKGTDTIAKIYATTPGKTKGYVSLLSLNKAFVENNKSFNVISTNGAGGTLAIISLSPNGKINFISTGGNPDWEANGNQYFMNMKVTNPEGKITYSEKIYMHSNFNNARSFLQGKKLPVGTVITFEAPKSNSQAKVAFNDMDKNQSDLNPSKVANLNEWNIVVTKDGLEYLHNPNIYITNIMKTLTINTLPTSTLTITIGNRTYSDVVGINGKVTIDLPKNLKVGEKVTYSIKFNSKELFNTVTSVKAFNSTLTITNPWKQAIGDLTFNYIKNRIEVNEGWAVINPYLKGEAFKLTLENKQGDIIKSITGDGGAWIASDIFNTFNNVDFKVGDKFIIQYKSSTHLLFNKLITSSGISPYDVKKSTTVYITKNGLSLVKPIEHIVNKTQLTKVITEGNSDVNSASYNLKSLKALEQSIAAGKAILNNSNATQSEVNNEVNIIDKAIDGLVKKANESALKEAITKANTDINSKAYTPDSVKALENDIVAANNILNNSNATQNEVNNEVSAINKAIDGLVKKANKDALKEVIAKANTDIDSKAYTPDSVKFLENDIAAANTILNNLNVTQNEINNEVNVMNKAIDGLMKKANTKALEKIIATGINDINSKKFSSQSEKALEKALENGKLTLNDINATQNEINNDVNVINKAINGLVKKANESTLKEDIAKANTDINSKAYTPDSVKSLANDVVAGKTVLNNPNATQNEVNNEVNVMNKAIDGLVKKPNTEALEKVIARGTRDINSKEYNSQSKNVLEKALENGKIILNDPNATQNEVNSNVNAINEAINQLKKNDVVKKEKHKGKPEVHKKKVNESALKEDITKVNKDINSKAYTPDSVKVLENDVVTANTILNNSNATQNEINNEVNVMNKAIDGLVKKANTKALEKVIATGTSDVNSKKFSSQSESALEKTLQEGMTTLSNPNTTQKEVNNEVSAINKAIDGLVKKTNKDALKEAIAKANADINSKAYTLDSVKALENDVVAANNILNNSNVTQNEVDNEVSVINKVIDGLVKKANKDALKRAIAKANADISSKAYMPDSVKALENDVVVANTILNNSNATQNEINNEVNVMNKAIDGLVKKVNTKALEKVIATGRNDINSKKFSSQSEKALEKALENGKITLNDPNATQHEVNNGVTAIDKAIDRLVKNTKIDNKTIKNNVNELQLKRDIKEGQSDVNSGIYTPDSLKKLEQAIKNGQKILNNKEVTQEEVNIANDNIINALNSLSKKGNKEQLKKAINSAMSYINSNNYTSNSVDNLKNSIENANNDLNNPNLSEGEVRQDIKAMNEAIGKLTTNETGLKGVIAKAKAQIGSNKYTPNSVKVVKVALSNGEKLLENSKVTPQEVHKAESSINNALNNLVYRANTSELKKAINNAKNDINSKNYTRKSIKNLVKVVNDGQALLKDLNTTQNQINNEVNNIENAINGLKKIIITPKKSEVNNNNNNEPKKNIDNHNDNQVKKSINTLELKNIIKSGESYIDSNKYTETSIKVLENAIKSGNELLNTTNITQNEVNNEVQVIEKAIKGLDLKNVERKPTTNNKEKQTNAKEKINNSKEKTNNNGNQSDNSGKQTNNNENKINKKQHSNIIKPEKTTNKPQSTTKKILVNKSGLKKLIEKGESDINSGSYTPNSIKSLESQLNNGKELLNNSNVTKEQVNNVVNAINKAIDGLKVNKDTLKNEIAKAKSMVSGKKYSKSSVENIEKAINDGEGLLNNNNATPTEIHNASTNITNSLNELPNTGLNKNNRTTEGALGMLGVMVAALSALFIFKKKK